MLTPSLITLSLLLAPALAEIALGGSPPPEGGSVPPKVDPTIVENFNWSDPFTSPKLAEFGGACESQRTFAASEYQLHDLEEPEPKGLWPYAEALKGLFGGRPYPGSWAGVDAHGYERNLLKMEYAQLPLKVREWIEEQDRADGLGKGLFAIYDKPSAGERLTRTAELPKVNLRSLDEKRVVIFAPAAVYESLPLWVAEGSDCEGTLADLNKYSTKLVDGGVIGWATGTSARRSWQEREVEFTVKAQVLSAKVDASGKTGAHKVGQTEGKDEL